MLELTSEQLAMPNAEVQGSLLVLEVLSAAALAAAALRERVRSARDGCGRDPWVRHALPPQQHLQRQRWAPAPPPRHRKRRRHALSPQQCHCALAIPTSQRAANRDQAVIGRSPLLECRVQGCNRHVPLAEMRGHVGAHILLGDCSPPDAEPALPAQGICGWCGGEGHTTTLGKGKAAATVRAASSTCSYKYLQLRYKSASRGSKTSPCTNVPVACAACQAANNATYVRVELLLPRSPSTATWAVAIDRCGGSTVRRRPSPTRISLRCSHTRSSTARKEPAFVSWRRACMDSLGTGASAFWRQIVKGGVEPRMQMVC